MTVTNPMKPGQIVIVNGTSGSGNHFAEFGVLSLPQGDADLGLEAGEYVAVLSHSGSRGTGAAVCSTYSNIARAHLPKKYESAGRLAWPLPFDSNSWPPKKAGTSTSA